MKVPVTQEEKNLPYYKYFERELAPVPEEALKRVSEGPMDRERFLPLDQINDFIQCTDSAFCQDGYAILEDNTGAISSKFFMPHVTPEMLDWWFPWHSVGSDLRYKIWDPEDHYFATAHPAATVLDPSVPVNQKTWNVDHYIVEDVGFGPKFTHIRFIRPKDIGIDESLIGTETCAGLVCGIGMGLGAVMVHKWYPEKDGVIFQSRFWLGWGLKEDSTIGKTLPEGMAFPMEFCRNMYSHELKEFTNLMAILPEVYAEEKENW